MAKLKKGNVVELIEPFRTPVPHQGLIAVVEGLPGETVNGQSDRSWERTELEVVFPVEGATEGGFDFWPVDEVRLVRESGPLTDEENARNARLLNHVYETLERRVAAREEA